MGLRPLVHDLISDFDNPFVAKNSPKTPHLGGTPSYNFDSQRETIELAALPLPCFVYVTPRAACHAVASHGLLRESLPGVSELSPEKNKGPLWSPLVQTLSSRRP